MRSFERHGWDRWPRYHLARSSVVRGHDRGELRTTGGYRAARWQVLVDRIIRRLLIVRPRINSSERTRDFAARIAIHESRPCSCRSFRESPSTFRPTFRFSRFVLSPVVRVNFSSLAERYFGHTPSVTAASTVPSVQFFLLFFFFFFSRIIMYIFKRDSVRNTKVGGNAHSL